MLEIARLLLDISHCRSLAKGLEEKITECPNVKTLDVSSWGEGNVVERITKIFPNVTNLSIGNKNLNDGGVQSIVKAYPGLTRLSVCESTKISGIPLKSNAEPNEAIGFKSIADKCTFLKELDVSYCDSFDGNTLRYFADSFPNSKLMAVTRSSRKMWNTFEINGLTFGWSLRMGLTSD